MLKYIEPRIFIILMVLGITLVITNAVDADIQDQISYGISQNTYSETHHITPIGGNLETLQTDPKSYRDEYRSEYDLEAQRRMAFWTKWIAILTLLGIILLSFTLYFTGVTLSEARKATIAAENTTTETRRIGDAQTRAYINFKKGEIIYEEDAAFISFSVENTGNSSAGSFYIGEGFFYEKKTEIISKPVSLNIGPKCVETIWINLTYEKIPKNVFICHASWNDIFGKRSMLGLKLHFRDEVCYPQITEERHDIEWKPDSISYRQF